jgi:hypothetical protein
MSRAVAGASEGSFALAPRGIARRLQDYFQVSSQPLVSLAFLALPLAVYEVGTWWLASRTGVATGVQILAFSYVRQFLAMWGATAAFLPALAVVVILLAWHMVRRDRWRVPLGVLATMAAESVLLALPLLGLAQLMGWHLPLGPTYSEHDTLIRGVILSFGAGIYEELVFRLAAIALLSLLLVDVLQMDRRWAVVLMVVLSAAGFSAYHHLGPGAPPFAWRDFTFRGLCGAYFCLLLIHRGFGITAGSHASYDIFCAALATLSPS